MQGPVASTFDLGVAKYTISPRVYTGSVTWGPLRGSTIRFHDSGEVYT